MQKIVKGNDFTLRVAVAQMVNGESVAFPLPACEELKVRLCGMYKRTPLQYNIDAEKDNVLLASVDGTTIAIGKYALEVSGTLLGKHWRSEEYPQIEIVSRNADGNTEFGVDDEGDKSVDLDTMLVVIPPSIELRDLIDETKITLAKCEKAVSDAMIAIDYNPDRGEIIIETGTESSVNTKIK